MSTSTSTLLLSSNVNIYAIPPLKSTSGHRAKQWDLSKPLWQGMLHVIEKSTSSDHNNAEELTPTCELQLLSADDTKELFAMAPYSKDGAGVTPVTDSSRYYTIRVVDGSKSAVLGMGFPDKSDAFDFNLALQAFKRRANPQFGSIIKMQGTTNEEDGQDQARGVEGSLTERQQEQQHVIPPPLLPPPPSSKSAATSYEEDDNDDDSDNSDFGDFQS